jgi:hydroxylaminobenzene mutase
MEESRLVEKPVYVRRGQTLLEVGVFLFLVGLLIGLGVPFFENPRMGLSSHLEALFNGVFLIIVGLLWGRLYLSLRLRSTLFWLLIYGSMANVCATLLAAIWGAGAMMPIAGNGMIGSNPQETIIGFLLVSLSLAMISGTILLLKGLQNGRKTNESHREF